MAPLALALAGSLLLAACDDTERAADAAPAAPPPPEVGYVTLHSENVALTEELPGRTVAYRIAEVRPQVDGIILERLFEEGAQVEAGEPLYQIDPASYQARVKAAEAELQRATATLQSSSTRVKRYRQLVGSNAVSQQDYDDRVAAEAEDRAAVAAAEAQLESARIDLEYTVVEAPIGGRIGRSNVTEGALVTANQAEALATVTQLDPIYVDLNQSSAELLRLRRAIAAGEIKLSADGAATVRLRLDVEGTPYPHKGQVQFSEVLVDRSTGMVNLRAVFPNPDGMLLPGLFVRAVVEQGVVEDAFLVPQAAVVRGADGSAFVWTIGEGDQVAQQPVTVRQAVGDSWLVTAGLSDGVRVVLDGLQRIGPGVTVTPVAVEKEGGPGTPVAAKPADTAG